MRVRVLDLAGLYVTEHGRVGRLIHRIVRNRSVVEDLLHDSFVKLLGVSHDREIADPRAYLVRIARNIAIDHHRHQKHWSGDGDADAALFLLADPAPTPEAALADRQALAITGAAIASMPERTRLAFEMHRLEDRTLVEIGLALGISKSLAGKLIQDAYGLVRERLREAGDI